MELRGFSYCRKRNFFTCYVYIFVLRKRLCVFGFCLNEKGYKCWLLGFRTAIRVRYYFIFYGFFKRNLRTTMDR